MAEANEYVEKGSTEVETTKIKLQKSNTRLHCCMGFTGVMLIIILCKFIF
jgi:hypothetical protein